MFAAGAVFVAAASASAQSLARRVDAVRDGVARFSYPGRPEACGDGKDVITLGRTLIVYPSVEGHGTTNTPCVAGPVRAAITLTDGSISSVRVYVGGRWSASASGRDLGEVEPRDAAEYMFSIARRLSGRAAKAAIAGAALAEGVDDAWRELLTIAREDDRANDVRRAALFWLPAVAREEAVRPLTTIARDSRERRELREAALGALGEIDAGAGVPALIAMAERDDSESSWLREKAVFWLGNAAEERGRARVRLLAERDSVPERIRDQAIFALGHLDRDADNGAFLRSLFGRLESERLRKKVIQSIAQQDDPESERFLLRIVQDPEAPKAVRKDALFWAGQSSHTAVESLVGLYAKLTDRDIRHHYTFVLSQRHEGAAVDKLIDIARNDADRTIRHQAVFWLGQSRDPKATRFIREQVEK
jgi:HEAT repeat protein